MSISNLKKKIKILNDFTKKFNMEQYSVNYILEKTLLFIKKELTQNS